MVSQRYFAVCPNFLTSLAQNELNRVEVLQNRKKAYRKILKIWTSEKIPVLNYPKIGTVSFCYTVLGPKDADGMANSVDPDQTAPEGAV